MKQTISRKDIKIGDRQRKQYDKIPELADSIRRFGLLQPVILDQHNNLLFGGRRLRACDLLGLEQIDICYRETMTLEEREEVELEENTQRDDIKWTERCIAVSRIYTLRKNRGVLEGWTWGQRETAAMFNMQLGTVNYTLKVAERLIEELDLPEDQRKYHKFASAAEAYRIGLLGEEQARVEAELARRQREMTAKGRGESAKTVEAIKLVTAVAQATAPAEALAVQRAKYQENPLNTVPFDEFWAEKVRVVDEVKRTVYLSTHYYNVDCIEFMSKDEHKGFFDHIVTDIPYGIDMENLNQQNPNGQLKDLDTVINEHDVKENEQLMARFFPAAFVCTRPTAYVAVCCDVMQWQYMYDLAVAAGFRVQRWPITWVKTSSCMNQCAQYNTTKNTEIIMLCRKPGAVLAKSTSTSVIIASAAQAQKETGHPFAKPYELTAFILDAISSKGQTILEPFAGRGSIAIEGIRQERDIIACEKQEAHYNALLENVKRYYLSLNKDFIFK